MFLDQTRYDLSPTTTLLGCTIHSRIQASQQDRVTFGLYDFYNIPDWTVPDHNTAHASDLAWLKSQIRALTAEASSHPTRHVMVLTHHSPTTDPQALDPGHAQSKISSGFMTDLSKEECWTSPLVRLWMFGHTHFNCDFVEEEGAGMGKRVLANQRGDHFAAADDFNVGKVVALGVGELEDGARDGES